MSPMALQPQGDEHGCVWQDGTGNEPVCEQAVPDQEVQPQTRPVNTQHPVLIFILNSDELFFLLLISDCASVSLELKCCMYC